MARRAGRAYMEHAHGGKEIWLEPIHDQSHLAAFGLKPHRASSYTLSKAPLFVEEEFRCFLEVIEVTVPADQEVHLILG